MQTSLVLRTSNANGTSRNGFQWPTSGPVECSDWNPAPQCGGGLHGLMWGDGDWSLLSSANDALWQVVEVVTECIVTIDSQKVKFPRGTVIYSGGMAGAITMVLNHQKRFEEMVAEINKGSKGKEISSGDSSTAASSGNSSKAASSGDYSTAASSGDYSKAAAKGKDTIAMACGTDCTVMAGENGSFATAYYDEKGKRNRILVGYVGEDGIKADTPYIISVTKAGKASWKEIK